MLVCVQDNQGEQYPYRQRNYFLKGQAGARMRWFNGHMTSQRVQIFVRSGFYVWNKGEESNSTDRSVSQEQSLIEMKADLKASGAAYRSDVKNIKNIEL